MKQPAINEIRAFNCFYTNIIGLVNRHILESNYSLPEVRVLYELYHLSEPSASDIIALLDLDKGYLSRILRGFEKNKMIRRSAASSDKRSAILQLTAKGRKEFELLNTASDRQIAKTFENLDDNECNQLVQKMTEIQQIILNKK